MVAFGKIGEVGVHKVVSAIALSAPLDTSKTIALGRAGGGANSWGHVVTVREVESEGAVLWEMTISKMQR